MLQKAGRSLGHWLRHWPRRKIVAVGAGFLALLLIGVTATGYEILHHFNANIQQDDISGLLGAQPVNTHPQAENIMVIGSDSRDGLNPSYGTGLVTDQSDTLMVIHIPADRQWAEVMSIPRDSWVNIPACEMGDGQSSSPTQFKINEAFAIGNLDGNRTRLGVACTVKTVEQDTGIYINHFMVVNFTGFENMVAALGGVYECNPTAIDDPNSDLHLSAGSHLLTPTEALGYVRARYTLGDGSDLERITRQQAFMSSLVSRVRGELYNPLAVYRFLDAFTKSLTIDTQLGGITGLYDLGQSLRAIPSSKIAFFTLPNYTDPSATANVLWTQPEDGQIFASFRDDVPTSSSLFGVSTTASRPTAGTSSAPSGLTGGSPHLTGRAGSPAATAATAATATATAATASAATATASPRGTLSASPGARLSASPLPIQGRTANQSICAG